MAIRRLFARLIISFSLLTAGAAQLITPVTAADPAALEALGDGKDSPSIETEFERLNRAIGLEKQAPAPDAYFLLWTLARKAEILGNKSDPLAVGEEGLGRPGDAVRAAQEALSYADRAAKPQNAIGPTPNSLKFDLWKLIGRRSLDEYELAEAAFEAAHPMMSLDQPAPPKWRDQADAKALEKQAEAALRKALQLETSDAREIWQPSGRDRLLVRKLLVDVLWREDRWRDLFMAVLDLEALIHGDDYLQADLSPSDYSQIAALLQKLPGSYASHLDLVQHGMEPAGDAPSEEETGLFFKVLQATQANEDALTLDRLASRFSPADPKIAEQLHKLQELVDAKKAQDRIAAIEVESQFRMAPSGEALAPRPVSAAITRSVDLGAQIKELWQGLGRENPALADAVRPPILDVAEVQHRLGRDEALVQFYTDNLQVVTWVVTQTGTDYFIERQISGFLRGPPQESTTHLIQRLRRALDLSDGIQPFDTDAAYALYRRLLGGARRTSALPEARGWSRAAIGLPHRMMCAACRA